VCTTCADGSFSASGATICITYETDEGKKTLFSDRGSREENVTKDEQRSSFKTLFNKMKDTMTDGRIKLQKEDLVLSDRFLERLGSRTEVDVLGSGVKDEAALVDCTNADVKLESQLFAYSVLLNNGDTALFCNKGTPITKLAYSNNQHTAHCYVNNSWVAATSGSTNNTWAGELLAEEDDYACSDMVFTIGSGDGITCDVTLDSSATAGNCGNTLAEGASCQPICNTNTVSGPTTCLSGIISNTVCTDVQAPSPSPSPYSPPSSSGLSIFTIGLIIAGVVIIIAIIICLTTKKDRSAYSILNAASVFSNVRYTDNVRYTAV
jgi:hypothetical protein